MKTGLPTASFLLTCAFVSAAGAATVVMSPPPAPGKTQAQPKVIAVPAAAKPSAPAKAAVQAKVIAVPAAAKPSAPTKAVVQAKADCPCNCPPHRKAHADARPPHMRRQAHGGNYHYAAAVPFRWHGHWRVAPGDAVVPGALAAPSYEVAGLSIEDRGWTGGVGMAPDGGGFIDGYGQAHFANGGSVENGPTYNGYGQSFQYNPSQAGPFQPRSMGGFAPPGSR